MIELMPWYKPGESLLRCGGEDGCGALLIAGDAEVHARWHQRVKRIEDRLDRPADFARTRGSWG